MFKKCHKLIPLIYLLSGFAASNISESYDAKIFSVAVLLSSYLIYNSVKVSELDISITDLCGIFLLDN